MKEAPLIPHFPNAPTLTCSINRVVYFVVERKQLGRHRLVFSHTGYLMNKNNLSLIQTFYSAIDWNSLVDLVIFLIWALNQSDLVLLYVAVCKLMPFGRNLTLCNYELVHAVFVVFRKMAWWDPTALMHEFQASVFLVFSQGPSLATNVPPEAPEPSPSCSRILREGPAPAVKWLEPRSSSRRSVHSIAASTVGERRDPCNQTTDRWVRVMHKSIWKAKVNFAPMMLQLRQKMYCMFLCDSASICLFIVLLNIQYSIVLNPHCTVVVLLNACIAHISVSIKSFPVAAVIVVFVKSIRTKILRIVTPSLAFVSINTHFLLVWSHTGTNLTCMCQWQLSKVGAMLTWMM